MILALLGHCAKRCWFIRGTLNPSQSEWMRHQEPKPMSPETNEERVKPCACKPWFWDGRSQDGLNELASSYPTCNIKGDNSINPFTEKFMHLLVSRMFFVDSWDVEKRSTTSVCASQLLHLEDTWLRAPDHQNGTLDVSGCMNNCAPGEKDAVRVQWVALELWWGCVLNSYLLQRASTISTCTAHPQRVFF